MQLLPLKHLLSSPLVKVVFLLLFTPFFSFQHFSLAEVDQPPPVSDSTPKKANQTSKKELKVVNDVNQAFSISEGDAVILLRAEGGDFKDVKVSVVNLQDPDGKHLPEMQAINIKPEGEVVIEDGKVVRVTIQRDKAYFKKDGNYKAEFIVEATSSGEKKDGIIIKQGITLAVSNKAKTVPPVKRPEEKDIPTFVVVKGKWWGVTNKRGLSLPLVQTKGEALATGQPILVELLIREDGVIPRTMRITNTVLSPQNFSADKKAELQFDIEGAKEVGTFTATIHIPSPELSEAVAVPIKIIVKHHWGWFIGVMIPGVVVVALLTSFWLPAEFQLFRFEIQELRKELDKLRDQTGDLEEIKKAESDLIVAELKQDKNILAEVKKTMADLKTRLKEKQTVSGNERVVEQVVPDASSLDSVTRSYFQKQSQALEAKPEMLEGPGVSTFGSTAYAYFYGRFCKSLGMKIKVEERKEDRIVGRSISFYIESIENPKEPILCEWDYGDGSRPEQMFYSGKKDEKVHHPYSKPNKYTIFLKKALPSGKGITLDKTRIKIKRGLELQTLLRRQRCVISTAMVVAVVITVVVGLYTTYWKKPFGSPADYLETALYAFGISSGTGFIGVLSQLFKKPEWPK
ncbi:MAG: hypothetical protein QMD05_07965 [Candidatus Brocadiaceae bacterium]|nr:hypothetical protein [Candidatus Brocadiaceae bacterium]